MKFLFLYTELATYFITCCEALAQHGEVHIVRWPVNPEAPFNFVFRPDIAVHEHPGNKEALLKLLHQIDPDLIVTSGWIDKIYLSVLGSYRKNIPKVLALDTRWKGSLRQWTACFLSRVFIRPRFTHAWVPGSLQQQYARRLGFSSSRIHEGFYSCDLAFFNKAYQKRIGSKPAGIPRRFIYTGRYYEFKGLADLWAAFASLNESERKGWELWCAGTGSLAPYKHPHIRHFGFVQPAELPSLMADTGVFILPSRFEPWAVVVHEFAAAGFPLLLSDEVGAAEAFLQEGVNGFSFKAGNVEQIRKALLRIIDLSDKDLLLMAAKSHEAAQAISPDKWALTALKIADGWNN